MSKYVLSIDQGTTSSRAILFDQSATPVAVAQRELKQYYPQPGWVEHDPLEIWLTVVACMAELFQNRAVQPADIAALGLTNQRETVLIWDKNSGLPIYPAICWQSRQSAPLCESLRRQGKEAEIRAKTGLVLDPYFSASKLRFILDIVPGAQERAERGELLAGTIDTWLLWKLSNAAVHATDLSNASRTQLLNIHSGEWDSDLLELFQIPRQILPELKESSGLFGYTSPLHFFGQSVPIAGIAGDQQAALYGQACFAEGQAKNTYGTGCFLLLQTGSKAVNSEHGLISSIAWKIDGKISYCLEGSVFMGGSVIQWLRDSLGLIHEAKESESLALTVPDSGGLVLVPAFTGLGAPYWDHQARGTILGLTRGSNRAQIVRAALESIALQNADVLAAMAEDSGFCLRSLAVDGGASANNFLLQFQADILNCELRRSAVLETTALGAALLAGRAVGFWPPEYHPLQDSQGSLAPQIFRPQLAEPERAAILRRWQRAIAACRLFAQEVEA